MDSVDAQDSFRTWLMYLPPGGDSRYVPLREIKWFWHGVATRTSPGVWQLNPPPATQGGDHGWGFEGAPYPSPPEWSVTASNSDLGNYTPPVP